MRAAAYLRVSSAAQRKESTIDAQRRDVPAYIRSMGWEHVATYEDDGLSAFTGKLDARLGYARMIADAKAGRFDVVVVCAFDRLTRSEDPIERASVTGRLHTAGVKIAVLGAGIQRPDTFAGDVYIALMGAIAAEESRIKSARTIAGHLTAIERGWHASGVVPYGYRFDREAKTWKHDGARAEIAREVFERIASGERTWAVAEDLERRGVQRPRGGRWTPERIYQIIHSDTYVGRRLANVRRKLVVSVPPLVDDDTAAAARGALASRHRSTRARTKHPTLLAGIARCGLCGAPIGIGDYTARPAIVHGLGYRCIHRRLPPVGQPKCQLPILYAPGTDERVWSALMDLVSDPGVIDRVLAHRDQPPAVDPQPFRDELARVGLAQDAVMRQLADGEIDQALADAQIARLGAKRKTAQAGLGAALAAQRGLRSASGADDVAEAIAALRRGADVATVEERRAIVEMAVAKATVRGEVIAMDLSFDAPTMIAGHGLRDSKIAGDRVRQGLRVLGIAPRPQTHRPAAYLRDGVLAPDLHL